MGKRMRGGAEDDNNSGWCPSGRDFVSNYKNPFSTTGTEYSENEVSKPYTSLDLLKSKQSDDVDSNLPDQHTLNNTYEQSERTFNKSDKPSMFSRFNSLVYQPKETLVETPAVESNKPININTKQGPQTTGAALTERNESLHSTAIESEKLKDGSSEFNDKSRQLKDNMNNQNSWNPLTLFGIRGGKSKNKRRQIRKRRSTKR